MPSPLAEDVTKSESASIGSGSGSEPSPSTIALAPEVDVQHDGAILRQRPQITTPSFDTADEIANSPLPTATTSSASESASKNISLASGNANFAPVPATASGSATPSAGAAVGAAAAAAHRRKHSRTNSLGYTSPTEIVPLSPAARRMSMTTTPQSSASLPAFRSQSVWEMVLEHEQVLLSVLVGSLTFTGIMYSLIHDSSLDTSHIHHIHNAPRPAYFARKSNLINVIFVKQAWGWTSLLYLLHLFTSSPPSSPLNPSISSRARKFAVWALATLAWLGFTRWFFGAGLGDRIIALTGGNCAFPLPANIDVTTARAAFPSLFTTGTGSGLTSNEKLYVPLPAQFCAGSQLNPSTFPELFKLLPISSFPGNTQLGMNLEATARHESLTALPRPRWHKGFDISGHAFLLVLSILILGRELSTTWRRWARTADQPSAAGSGVGPNRKLEKEFGRPNIDGINSREGEGANSGNWTLTRTLHDWVGLAATGLLGIWCWMILMTAVYFHNPPEKLSGLALGLATAWLINVIVPSPKPTVKSPFDSVSSTGHTQNQAQSSIDSFRSHAGKKSHSRTHSHSNSFGPALGIGQVLDENAARRGGIVDDGVIYEDEEEGGDECARSGAKIIQGGREKVE